jgi:hypothetical protein
VRDDSSIPPATNAKFVTFRDVFGETGVAGECWASFMGGSDANHWRPEPIAHLAHASSLELFALQSPNRSTLKA